MGRGVMGNELRERGREKIIQDPVDRKCDEKLLEGFEQGGNVILQHCEIITTLATGEEQTHSGQYYSTKM